MIIPSILSTGINALEGFIFWPYFLISGVQGKGIEYKLSVGGLLKMLPVAGYEFLVRDSRE